MLEFLFASYKQIAGLYDLTMIPPLDNWVELRTAGLSELTVLDFIGAAYEQLRSDMASAQTDHEFHLWTREWS